MESITKLTIGRDIKVKVKITGSEEDVYLSYCIAQAYLFGTECFRATQIEYDKVTEEAIQRARKNKGIWRTKQ